MWTVVQLAKKFADLGHHRLHKVFRTSLSEPQPEPVESRPHHHILFIEGSFFFPLRSSRQRTWTSSRLLWYFFFLRWVVAPCPNRKLKSAPFRFFQSAYSVRDNCRPSPPSATQGRIIPWWQETQLRWTKHTILIAYRTNQILIFQIQFITTLPERNWRWWWIAVISEDDGMRENYIKGPGTCTGFRLVRKAITQVSQISTLTIHEQ